MVCLTKQFTSFHVCVNGRSVSTPPRTRHERARLTGEQAPVSQTWGSGQPVLGWSRKCAVLQAFSSRSLIVFLRARITGADGECLSCKEGV